MEAAIKPIYIVDDEKSICDSLNSIFSDEGYTVITCNDADSFFAKAANTPPALVFLDVWLPGIDGLDILGLLQKKYPAIPVIMMSGYAGIDSAVNAIKIGAYDFVEKPLDIDILVDKVSKALNKEKQDSLSTNYSTPLEKAYCHSEDHLPISLIPSDQPQRTLAKDIVLNGTGLLSGRKTGIILSPLDENRGIMFKTLNGQYIPAHVASLENFASDQDDKRFTANSTVLVEKNTRIKTVEHLMSSFSMIGLSNILIKADNEIPNIDGSAIDFCKLIWDAGIVEQSTLCKKIVINQKMSIGVESHNEKYIYVEPFCGFEVTMRINYPAPICEQIFTFNPEKQSFLKEIAPARSFNTFENIGLAQKLGKVGGGYLDSHIIIHDGSVINTELRYPDEFVRHKILDLIGDLYLLGYPIQGKIIGNMTSHGYNHALTRIIYSAIQREYCNNQTD
jgi:UDP-3-O-[3-hydroxymyristoyl] N-acetylglucosamine deacetylase